jgi:hypothetical protein
MALGGPPKFAGSAALTGGHYCTRSSAARKKLKFSRNYKVNNAL